MYEEFEKLNCQHIQELDRQNNNNAIHQYNYLNNMCNTQYDISKESDMLITPYLPKTHCDKYESISDDNTSVYCCGYECLNSNSFYHEPEKLNTYHNYLVLQNELHNDEMPIYCTENHQIFRNWTRRKMPVIEKDVFYKSENTNSMDEYFQELPKLKFNECNPPDDRLKYTC